jgi:hypothetical protein
LLVSCLCYPVATVLWCGVRNMRKCNGRTVVQKATPCITRSGSGGNVQFVGPYDHRLYNHSMLHKGGYLLNLRNRQQWFCDFQSHLPIVFLSMTDQKVILSLIKQPIDFTLELTSLFYA